MNEICDVLEQNNELSGKNELVMQENNALAEKNEILVNSVGVLEIRIIVLEKEIAEKEFSATPKKTREDHGQLREDKARLEVEVKELLESKDVLQKKAISIINSLKEKVTQLTNENAIINEENFSLTDKIDNLGPDIKDLQIQVQNLTLENSALNTKLEKLKIENTDLLTKTEQSPASTKELTEVKKQNLQLLDQKKKLMDQLNHLYTLNEQNQDLQKQIALLQNEVAEHQEEYQQLQDNYQQLEKDFFAIQEESHMRDNEIQILIKDSDTLVLKLQEFGVQVSFVDGGVKFYYQ